MMLLNCTLKAQEIVGVLWKRFTMYLNVVELWLCFKIQEVCNSLVTMVHSLYPSETESLYLMLILQRLAAVI